MAAPSYATDLSTQEITAAESTTGWAAYGGGGAGLDNNADIAMQGSFCVAKQITNADKGVYYTGTASLSAGDHIFVWLFCGTPGLTDLKQNKGVSILVGSSSNNYCQYHVEGNDTYGAAGRVAKCYPIDYSVRSTSATEPYRSATGNPGATPSVFGGGLVTTAAVKGFNLGVDAIRYGTGAYITLGEVATPATFAGFQATNDAIANRWGLLTRVGGAYELQGAFVVGRTAAGTATASYFEDSDQTVSIAATEHTSAGFTYFEFDHASTTIKWTNISITALGTTSRGNLNVTAANPTVDLTGCTFTQMGTFTFQSNSTISNVTFRQTDTVTQNGAAITDGSFDRSRAAYSIIADSLANLTGNTFTSDGSNTAVQFTGSAGSYSWNNFLSGYDAGSAGNGVQITGGSITGNEAIYIPASSGTYMISVSDGADIPSVATGGAVVNVVAGQKNFTITPNPTPAEYEYRIYTVTAIGSLAGAVEVQGSESTSLASQTLTHGYTNQPVAVQLLAMDSGYEESVTYYTLTAADASVSIPLKLDTNA